MMQHSPVSGSVAEISLTTKPAALSLMDISGDYKINLVMKERAKNT